jgi:ribosomal protein L37E
VIERTDKTICRSCGKRVFIYETTDNICGECFEDNESQED